MITAKRIVAPLLTGACLAMAPFCMNADAAAAGTAPTTDVDQVPTVYVVPLEGQMGTDIHEDNIEDVIDDILEQSPLPNIVVLKIHSADTGTNYHLPTIDPKEFGMVELEAYRGLVRNMHNKLPKDIKQVVWVEDSVGFASLLALSWPDMYMAPDARLYGLYNVFQVSQGWNDADVREKMEEAWEGIGRGFLEMGGHGEAARELGSAMMDPSKMLSADFKGRKVIWRADTNGTWVIDNNNEGVANFEATEAEDTLLCDGIADSVNDLLFLMGYREYNTNTSGEELVSKYHDQWRRAYKASTDALTDINQGRGGGNSQLQQLLNQKRLWTQILNNMRRFNAVERRLSREFGLSIDNVKLRIEQLNDQIRQVKENGRGRSGGGGRGGGISGGGGRTGGDKGSG
jgi:hypothetical protein